VVPLSTPEIEARFGLSAGTAAGWTLAAFQALAAVLEPLLFALAERRRRRPLVALGLVATAACCIAAAAAPRFWVLLLAIALYGPASGCAIGLAQAALVDLSAKAPAPERGPDARARALTRWEFAASLGDLAAPVLLAALGAFALGHRAALVVVAACALALAAWLPRAMPEERSALDGEAAPGGGSRTFFEALRAPGLLLWAFACILCSLLDETLVAFGASYMHHALGASASTRGLAFAAWTAGSLVGLPLADRLLLRAAPLPVLVASTIACAAVHVIWLLVATPVAAVLGLFAVGLTASFHYPIVKAQAYAAVPGCSALVNAVVSALVPLEIAVPIALGVVADRVGPRAAMLALLAQPLGILALTARSALRGSSAARGADADISRRL
jgi:predicted MFS family arabinose efflux permease